MSIFNRGKEKPTSSSRPRIYRWEESATRRFNEEELRRLRDEHPADLAQALWEPGSIVQTAAIKELIAHGNPAKATLVARQLVEQHPACADSIREDFGAETAELILNADVLKVPNRPSEY